MLLDKDIGHLKKKKKKTRRLALTTKPKYDGEKSIDDDNCTQDVGIPHCRQGVVFMTDAVHWTVIFFFLLFPITVSAPAVSTAHPRRHLGGFGYSVNDSAWERNIYRPCNCNLSTCYICELRMQRLKLSLGDCAQIYVNTHRHIRD